MSSHEVNEKITPLPWTQKGANILAGEFRFQPRWEGVASSVTLKANAAYIVQACNAYPALVAEIERLRGALEKINSECRSSGKYYSDSIKLIKQISEIALSTEPARQK